VTGGGARRFSGEAAGAGFTTFLPVPESVFFFDADPALLLVFSVVWLIAENPPSTPP